MKKGFTLIELLVVVLIIGILSAIALPQYQKAVRKARLAQWDVMFDTSRKAIDIYLLENGGFPQSTVELTGKKSVASIQMPGNCNIDDFLCYTSAGGLHVRCSSSSCEITIESHFHADGTLGNKSLGEDRNELYWYQNQNSKFISHLDGKAACQWTASHPEIPISGNRQKDTCASLGITLSNPTIN